MKKIISILIVAVVVAVFSISCNKVCTCKLLGVSEEYPEATKDECDAMHEIMKIAGGSCKM